MNLLSRMSNLIKDKSDERKKLASIRRKANLYQFLESVGGIPENNHEASFQSIKTNFKLKKHFSKMTLDEILEELTVEFGKRPNGRVLKLIGFCYFHKGEINQAINTYLQALNITSEDPVAIYEDLGRCYIIKNDLDNARLWFSESYRYDFDFFLSVFGKDFLYVTAIGRVSYRPPIFGEKYDKFSSRSIKIELMADAISIKFGNKKDHKSLANIKVENEMQSVATEYIINSKKTNEDVSFILKTTSELLNELKKQNA